MRKIGMNCVRRLWNSEGGTQILTALTTSLYISLSLSIYLCLFSFRGEKETRAILRRFLFYNFQGGGGRMLTLPNNFESLEALPREIKEGAISVCEFLFLIFWYKFRWEAIFFFFLVN